MKKIYTSLIIAFFISNSYSQVGIGTTNPDASSILDINSNSSGLLIPRVNLSDVTNATSPIVSPAVSLLVYNTNPFLVGGNGVGYYYWNGSFWAKLVSTNDEKWNRNGFGQLYPTNVNDYVGIGTNNPFTNLHIVSSSSNPVIF